MLISENTLHEFGDKENMIRKIRRVLRHDGKAVIVDFKNEDIGFGPPVAIRVSETRQSVSSRKMASGLEIKGPYV